MPFAVLDDAAFAVEHFDFAPGDAAVLLTDGFYETANPAGELYGEERVIALLRKKAGLSLEALIHELHEEVQHFSHNSPQADDLTAVLIRRTS